MQSAIDYMSLSSLNHCDRCEARDAREDARIVSAQHVTEDANEVIRCGHGVCLPALDERGFLAAMLTRNAGRSTLGP